jgi:hypothetical protein
VVLSCVDSAFVYLFACLLRFRPKGRACQPILSRFYTTLSVRLAPIRGEGRALHRRASKIDLAAGQFRSLDRDRTVPDVQGSQVNNCEVVQRKSPDNMLIEI